MPEWSQRYFRIAPMVHRTDPPLLLLICPYSNGDFVSMMRFSAGVSPCHWYRSTIWVSSCLAKCKWISKAYQWLSEREIFIGLSLIKPLRKNSLILYYIPTNTIPQSDFLKGAFRSSPAALLNAPSPDYLFYSPQIPFHFVTTTCTVLLLTPNALAVCRTVALESMI